jgi:signal peptidase
VSSAADTPAATYAGAGAADPADAPASRRHPLRTLSYLVLLLSAMLLVGVVVAGANGMRIRVEQTGSMSPALEPGDMVLVRQVPVADIRAGDVIGVRDSRGKVIVHRVKTIETRPTTLRVSTQGDANPTGETWLIARTDQVALVKGSVPHLGSVIDAAKAPYAAIVVLLAGLLLAAGALRSIWSRP